MNQLISRVVRGRFGTQHQAAVIALELLECRGHRLCAHIGPHSLPDLRKRGRRHAHAGAEVAQRCEHAIGQLCRAVVPNALENEIEKSLDDASEAAYDANAIYKNVRRTRPHLIYRSPATHIYIRVATHMGFGRTRTGAHAQGP